MAASLPSIKPKPWLAPSWRNFPYLSASCVLGSVFAMASAFIILAKADGTNIDSWSVAPTVWLSIVTTVSNSLLRAAFRSGSDHFWWSKLLSKSGASLQDLHDVWDLTYNQLSLFTSFRSSKLQPVIRSAGILVLLVAINGPFLQRGVTVEIGTRESLMEATFPIRREPMWNLTSLVTSTNGWVWSAPPYQGEFAEVVQEMKLRQPITLRSPVCNLNSTCRANVTVSGFARSCSESRVPVKGLPISKFFQYVNLANAGYPGMVYRCLESGFGGSGYGDPKSIGNDTAPYCGYLKTIYQLSIESLTVDAQEPVDAQVPVKIRLKYPQGARPGEIPWKDLNLPPTMLNYTSYFRHDNGTEDSGTRIKQSCNFSSAFVTLPIEISSGTTVTLLPIQESKPNSQSISPYAIESIPKPLSPSGADDSLYQGLIQTLMDAYAGLILFDVNENSHFIQGNEVRQLINQSSIESYNPNTGPTYSMFDPLEEFTSTLREISLRYAMKTIPSDDPARIREYDKWTNVTGTSGLDNRARALAAMQTKVSTTQDITGIQETRTVAIYKAHYLFTGVAMGVTSVASVLIVYLMHGWRQFGRSLSLGPLELAKAFDAPLLGGIRSNVTGSEVAKGSLGELRVRYGEVHPVSELAVPRMMGRTVSSQSSVTGLGLEIPVEEGKRMGGAKLAVDYADRVVPPVNGCVYD